jgi:hypothetical protein
MSTSPYCGQLPSAELSHHAGQIPHPTGMCARSSTKSTLPVAPLNFLGSKVRLDVTRTDGRLGGGGGGAGGHLAPFDGSTPDCDAPWFIAQRLTFCDVTEIMSGGGQQQQHQQPQRKPTQWHREDARAARVAARLIQKGWAEA